MIVSEETRPTDAEVAAQWAAEALRDGRYELGAALANIARNANRAELAERAHDERTHAHELTAAAERARMVPLLGQTREEHPAAPAQRPAEPTNGPTGDGEADLRAIAAEAQTEVFGPPVSPAGVGPAQNRCNAEVIHLRGTERYREECRGPVWWDEQAPPGTLRWRHVDPALDGDHAPVVLAAGQ